MHTLFIDDKVDEDGPVFDSGVASAVAPVETGAAALDEPIASTAPALEGSVPSEPESAPPESAPPVVTEAPSPQIVTLAEVSFIPRGRYSGRPV